MTSSHEPLFIDLETYSDVDITTCGAYKYAESPNFRILLLAFAYGHDKVRIIDFEDVTDEDARLRKMVLSDIKNPNTIKVAHNCAFERACLTAYLHQEMPIEQWEDTMILGAMNGLPMSLDSAGSALHLKEQKIKEGANYIRLFSKPKSDGTRRTYKDKPEEWQAFKKYCIRDVEVEQNLYYKLKPITKITETERRVFECDARINDRGVMIDTELAEQAININNEITERMTAELKALTGCNNPNSAVQLKKWLSEQGCDVDSLDKAAVKELLDTVVRQDIRRVLQLRQQLSKTSTTKYATMLRSACLDNRVRGITQYYGAGRTGRWAGRLVQLQNLPQNHLDDIGAVRELVKQGDIEMLEMLYDSIPDTLSQLIRTALIAKPGHTFLVADYSAIEARVTAYLAGVKWRMDTFARGGDIYCQSASQMFHVPVEKHGINGHLRQKGKVAELACGYGGGVGALKAFGADKMGLSETEMQEIVNHWRNASPEIPKMWRDVEDRAVNALTHQGRTFELKRKMKDTERAAENEDITGGTGYSPYFLAGGYICKYKRDSYGLRCLLPSGRVLTYWGAEYTDEGKITYWAQNQTTRKWQQTETWGGKLVENIVQAFARDCLAEAMLRLEKAGYNICFHVHDEIIAEAPEGSRWQDMAEIMGQPVEWAPGLILTADGYSTPFYMKD